MEVAILFFLIYFLLDINFKVYLNYLNPCSWSINFLQHLILLDMAYQIFLSNFLIYLLSSLVPQELDGHQRTRRQKYRFHLYSIYVIFLILKFLIIRFCSLKHLKIINFHLGPTNALNGLKDLFLIISNSLILPSKIFKIFQPFSFFLLLCSIFLLSLNLCLLY